MEFNYLCSSQNRQSYEKHIDTSAFVAVFFDGSGH